MGFRLGAKDPGSSFEKLRSPGHDLVRMDCAAAAGGQIVEKPLLSGPLLGSIREVFDERAKPSS